MTVSGPDFSRALRGAQTGDNEAFSDLWRISNPILQRYLRITAPELANDVASATWVKIARGLRSVSGDQRSFRTLLVRIARDETAVRRRNSRRRPDAIIDTARAQAARCAAAARTDWSRRDTLTSDEVVPLVALLPADVAEMVALRVVVGLSAAETAAVMGLRSGSVIVAVHSGLRRTSNVIGTAVGTPATSSWPRRPVPSPRLLNPWELDHAIDLGEAGLSELDPALRTVVSALIAPSVPGDLSQLAAAHFAFERSLHRTFAFAPALLLPFLGRRLGTARSFVTGKVAVVALGTAVLSAPAAVAYSVPLDGGPPREPTATAATAAGAAGAVQHPLFVRLPALQPATPPAPADAPGARPATQSPTQSAHAAQRPTRAKRQPATRVKARVTPKVGHRVARSKPGSAGHAGSGHHGVGHHGVSQHRVSQHHAHRAQPPAATRHRKPDRPWWWIYLSHHR